MGYILQMLILVHFLQEPRRKEAQTCLKTFFPNSVLFIAPRGEELKRKDDGELNPGASFLGDGTLIGARRLLLVLDLGIIPGGLRDAGG